MARMWLQIKRWACAHHCYVEDIRRVSPSSVRCVCAKCGQTLDAPYGIALKARLMQRSGTTR